MSVDDTIRESLERLVHPVEDPDAVLAEVERRQARRRRRLVRARLLVAAVCFAVIGVGAVLSGNVGSNRTSDVVTTGLSDLPSERTETRPPSASTVTVFASNLGPLRFTTSGLSDVEHARCQAEARVRCPWLEHTVTIENTAPETIHVNDYRTGQFLGDREVLAGVGCGYGFGPGRPVEPACQLDYRPLTLDPGGKSTFGVTLWRGLEGMKEITSNTLILRMPFTYRSTPFSAHSQSGTQGELVVTYEHLDRPVELGTP